MQHKFEERKKKKKNYRKEKKRKENPLCSLTEQNQKQKQKSKKEKEKEKEAITNQFEQNLRTLHIISIKISKKLKKNQELQKRKTNTSILTSSQYNNSLTGKPNVKKLTKQRESKRNSVKITKPIQNSEKKNRKRKTKRKQSLNSGNTIKNQALTGNCNKKVKET